MALVPFPNKTAIQSSDDDLDPDDDPLDDHAGKMSFLDHLDELRKRIIWAVVSIGAGFLVSCLFIQRMFDFIMKPLQAQLPLGGHLVYTEPSEAFTLYIKIAVIGGIILASPAVMAQVWLFIAPGLYSHEKKLAIPFVVMSSFFFVTGAAFSHYVVFPMTWKFFVSFTTDYMTFMPRIEPAFALYMKLLLSFGLVFQMPTVVLFLARMGMITARFMMKNFKYAVLIIFIAAAVLTPDGSPVTQTAMAGPMVLLYLISVALAWLFGKKRRVEEA
ncbi:MAG: twin-arginine translocase subunit TatC [Acidobacteriota bacterium]